VESQVLDAMLTRDDQGVHLRWGMDTGEYVEYDGSNINGARVSGRTIYVIEMEY